MTRSGLATVGRRAAVVGACLIVGMGGALAGAGAASADSVTRDFRYNCEFPLTGFHDLDVRVEATLPDSVPVGQAAHITNSKVTVTVPEDLVAALGLFDAKSLDGSATSSGVVTSSSTTTVPLTLNVPSTPVPTAGVMYVPANVTGNPSFTPTAAGPHKLSLGPRFDAKLTPRKADGSETDLGTFDLPCTAVTSDRTITTVAVN